MHFRPLNPIDILVYINYIPANERVSFQSKNSQIAKDLGLNPDWLMTVYFAESKCNPGAYNSSSGASGIIQFLRSTAQSLGTTIEAIRASNGTKQLDWVYKYYLPYKGKIKNIYDCYFAVFYPKAIGKADSYVLFSEGSNSYSQNRNLDTNNDGKVTVKDVKNWFSKFNAYDGYPKQ